MSNQDSTAWSYKSWGFSQLVQTRQSYYKLRGRIFVVRKRTRSLYWVTLSVSAEDVVKLLCGPPNRVRSWCNLSAAASMDLGTRLVFKLKWHVTTSKVKSCAYYRKNWFASLKNLQNCVQFSLSVRIFSEPYIWFWKFMLIVCTCAGCQRPGRAPAWQADLSGRGKLIIIAQL